MRTSYPKEELSALIPKQTFLSGTNRMLLGGIYTFPFLIDTTRHFFLYFFPKSMGIHQGFV